MQLTIARTVEESLDFAGQKGEVKEIAKRIKSAMAKPDATGIIVRDGEKEILNLDRKHFSLIEELIAL